MRYCAVSLGLQAAGMSCLPAGNKQVGNGELELVCLTLLQFSAVNGSHKLLLLSRTRRVFPFGENSVENVACKITGQENRLSMKYSLCWAL